MAPRSAAVMIEEGRGRAARRAAAKQNGKLRERTLPDEAAGHLLHLQAVNEETRREYLEAAQNVVRGMGLPAPKEGHKWVVVPQERKVREVPDATRT